MPGLEWVGLYLLLGSVVGFIAGLLGAGGGGILVPLLAVIFLQQGMDNSQVVHMALATALCCMIISASVSSRAHAQRGAVQWPVVLSMAPGIMLGAFLIAQLSAWLNGVYIALFFAGFMALVAVQMFYNWQPKPSQQPLKRHVLMWVGVCIGAVSALAAVGGGFLSVVYLSYKRLTMQQAIGTSAALGLPLAIAGSVGYLWSGWSVTQHTPYMLGYIYLPAFIAISCATVISAPLGARFSQRLPEKILKRIFALISLLLSIKMLCSVL